MKEVWLSVCETLAKHGEQGLRLLPDRDIEQARSHWLTNSTLDLHKAAAEVISREYWRRLRQKRSADGRLASDLNIFGLDWHVRMDVKKLWHNPVPKGDLYCD